MAIKYVKDYYTAEDGTTRTDTKAIQAAIDALSDGDTLAFEEKKIYSLDAPVSFVSYNAAAKTGVTRKHLTIEGNSCTIAGSTTFINTYGCNPAKLDEAYCTSEQKAYENCNAFFYLSDPLKHGLEYCVIRNFNFAWRAPGVTGINDAWYWMQRRFRNSAIGVLGTNHALCAEIYGDDNQNMQSTYFKFGKIEGCYFYDLGCGIYLCGTLDEIERCHFNALSSNIANNILENCTGGGISVANSNPTRISDNTVYCNVPTAILVSQCGGSHICNNTLSRFTENGIKLVGSSASVIAGNMLKGNGSSDRCGIYSNANCKQMDIHGNTLYSFSRENAVVFTSAGPMYVENNAIFESDYTLSNPKDPMVVDTTMPALGVVKIPDTAKINDGDVIMLHMPKDFRAPTVASISFCDVIGSFCKESDGETMNPDSSYAGSFIKVKYTETANSDGSFNFKITVLGK